MKWKKGFEYDYDLPSLSETQREQNKELIKEINDRIGYTLDSRPSP